MLDQSIEYFSKHGRAETDQRFVPQSEWLTDKHGNATFVLGPSHPVHGGSHYLIAGLLNDELIFLQFTYSLLKPDGSTQAVPLREIYGMTEAGWGFVENLASASDL